MRPLIVVNCPVCNCSHEVSKNRANESNLGKILCSACAQNYRIVRSSDGLINYIYAPYRNKEWLYNEYVVNDRTASDIAKECSVNVKSIWDWIWKFKLPTKATASQLLPMEEVKILYEKFGISSSELSKLYGASPVTILSLLRSSGVEIPSFSELRKRYLWDMGGRDLLIETSRKEENRILMSCKQRNISIDEFDGFKKSENSLARISCDYSAWRNSVFKRDNYTCQVCGRRSKPGEPVRLNAHHIENFSSNEDLRYDIKNGITFCDRCHSTKFEDSFHSIYGTRNNTHEQLEEYIRNRRAELLA